MNLIAILRIFLLPFSVIYGIIVTVRNWMFDVNILKATSFKIPIITVGNLSVGGTGKTPQIEYLVKLLQNKYNIAVLSRGYKRKSKGFVLANENTGVLDIGDEPFQYHQKFKNIQVAVDGDRVNGVNNIVVLQPKIDVVLLDDAYQHRKIKAGYQILLSAYSDLFYKDFMMPTGNLRELWWGKSRADSIIVTKCPLNLSEAEQYKIIQKISPKPNQQVFFTGISYGINVKGSSEIALKNLVKQHKIVVVTGIAKPKPLIKYLEQFGIALEHLNYPDHHNFTKEELVYIREKSVDAKILTTEKDYVRLQKHIEELYYLPIEAYFLNNEEDFKSTVLKFVASKN